MKFESMRRDATPHSSAAEPERAYEKPKPPAPAAALHLAQPQASDEAEPAWDPLEEHARGILEEIGEDPERGGLLRTPARVAKALRFLTSGYNADVWELVNGALFDAEGYEEPILVKDIEFYSLCEHHMLPFFGKASVAYLPGKRIVGLSKIARLVDLYARRLQVQERMTKQIAEVLEEVLEPRGVAVSLTGTHLCMAMRGVEKQASRTTTTAFTGDYQRDPNRRKEFLALTKETTG
jgi:GTP cyclohydrolase I